MARMFGEISFRDAKGAKGAEYLDTENPTKRRFDVLASGLFLAALAVPATVALAGSRIDTGENPIFRQNRRQLNAGDIAQFPLDTFPDDIEELGTVVELLKIRTMPGENHTSQGVVDNRASKHFGQPLRSSGLDEVFQLLKVASGELSMTGTRLVTDSNLREMYDADPILFRDLYEKLDEAGVKPAIVSAGSAWGHRYAQSAQTPEYWRKRMLLDYHWPDNASLLGDIKLTGLSPFNMLAAKLRPLGDYIISKTEEVIP